MSPRPPATNIALREWSFILVPVGRGGFGGSRNVLHPFRGLRNYLDPFRGPRNCLDRFWGLRNFEDPIGGLRNFSDLFGGSWNELKICPKPPGTSVNDCSLRDILK